MDTTKAERIARLLAAFTSPGRSAEDDADSLRSVIALAKEAVAFEPPSAELSACCHATLGYDGLLDSNGEPCGGPYDSATCCECGEEADAWDGTRAPTNPDCDKARETEERRYVVRAALSGFDVITAKDARLESTARIVPRFTGEYTMRADAKAAATRLNAWKEATT